MWKYLKMQIHPETEVRQNRGQTISTLNKVSLWRIKYMASVKLDARWMNESMNWMNELLFLFIIFPQSAQYGLV
jgi:hypothetical protein